MGLSSSQARLLNLTARMHQIEYKAAKLEAQKLQMANESTHVYNEYLNALEASKIQYKSLNADGSITYKDATLASLENGLISSYNGEVSSTPFFLRDVKTNGIYISKDYAASIGITSDSETYDGSLNQWLTEKNAPTKVVDVVDHYNTVTDYSVITSVNTVKNSNYQAYTPQYYTL